jgi:16S rRNA A1518/A1519 N6-dimethyltransferase RsmA/KsgA/DIM1 with predicted DNA glycosylase/AP lyase activity
MAAIARRLRDCVFMLQREVVDRMVARPGTPEYGRLSDDVAVYASAWRACSAQP